MDIPARSLRIVGLAGQPAGEAEVEAALAARRAAYVPPERPGRTGVFGRYTRLARSAMQGGGLD